MILLNFAVQLNLRDIPAFTKDYLKSLKKLSSFRIFDHEKHPFKSKTIGQIKQLLGIKNMDSTKYRISQRKPKKERNKVKFWTIPPQNSPLFQMTYGGEQTTISGAESLLYGALAADGFTQILLPSDYMVSDRFPSCGSLVKNQGNCASCYAVSIIESLEDRICVATNMKTIVNLAPQNILSCDPNSYGCNGGYLDKTFDFLRTTGTIEESCFPYTSGTLGKIPKCILSTNKCLDGTTIKKFYKYQAYKKFTNSDDMKEDIYNYGSIVTGFSVFTDFISYEGGVYQLTPGSAFLGGHAVKVIGWGIEDGQEYWIAKNTWGNLWGEYGFFRFAMNSCCSFDVNGIAALPLIN